MGAITRALGNSLTTGGVVKSTAINNTSISGITSLPGAITGLGSLVLIKEITASASASIEFINGTNGVVLDSTYDSYVFSFIDIHPTGGNYTFGCQFSTDGGSTYTTTVTSTYFWAYHLESDATGFAYNTGLDQAQGTGTIFLNSAVNGSSDGNACGQLQLFNPSSTTFVKHFIARQNAHAPDPASVDNYKAGYLNTTSAINAAKFFFNVGNFDGIIKLYGVS